MRTKIIVFVNAATILLLSGCASEPVAITPIGPEPIGQNTYVPKGYIQVFSDTEEHVIGDGPPFYPHTGYNIYDEAGNRVQYVANHIGNMDELPTLVQIPMGNYKVVAESSAYGRVTVPVVIQSGKSNILHLDRGWRPPSTMSSNEVVRLPDGEAAGWSSEITKSSE